MYRAANHSYCLQIQIAVLAEELIIIIIIIIIIKIYFKSDIHEVQPTIHKEKVKAKVMI